MRLTVDLIWPFAFGFFAPILYLGLQISWQLFGWISVAFLAVYAAIHFLLVKGVDWLMKDAKEKPDKTNELTSGFTRALLAFLAGLTVQLAILAINRGT